MKVFFIQPGLVDLGGHYLLETRAWRDAVIAEGLHWRGYANAHLDQAIAKQEDVTPLFPYGTQAVIDPDSVSRPITDLLYLSEQFASAATLLPDVTGDDLVVVQFATCNEIYALARWLNKVPQALRPRVAVIIHVPASDWSYTRHNDTFSGSITAWRFAINQLKVPLGQDRIYLAAIDRRLAELLHIFLEIPVDVTPLVSYFDQEVLAHPRNKRFDLLFAGGLRIDKGAPLLAQILDGFEQQPRDTPLRIGLQLGTEADADVTRNRFEGAGNVRLDVVVGSLEPARYIKRLTECRVVVLPYQASAYAMRASGIAAEAFGYGIPVVVPADTWMSDRLAAGDGAGVTFEALRVESVTSASLSALRQHQQLAKSAKSKAAKWRDGNSALMALRRIRQTFKI